MRVPGNPFLPSPIVPCGATGCSVSDRSPRRNQSARPRANPKVHPDGPFRGPRHPLGQRSVRTARRPFRPRTLRPFRAAGPPIRLPSSATGENVERSRDSGKPDRSYVFAGLKEVSRDVFAGLSHVSRDVFAGLSHVSRAVFGDRSPTPHIAGPASTESGAGSSGSALDRPLGSLDIVHAKNPEGALPELRPLGVLHRSGFRYSGPARFATLAAPLRVTVPTNPRCYPLTCGCGRPSEVLTPSGLVPPCDDPRVEHPGPKPRLNREHPCECSSGIRPKPGTGSPDGSARRFPAPTE